MAIDPASLGLYSELEMNNAISNLDAYNDVMSAGEKAQAALKMQDLISKLMVPINFVPSNDEEPIDIDSSSVPVSAKKINKILISTPKEPPLYISDLFLKPPPDDDDLIFSIPTPVESTMFTPCSFLTYQNDIHSFQSEFYQFANVVANVPSCSHPERSDGTAGLVTCPMMHDQSHCELYSSTMRMLASTTVQAPHANHPVVFDLVYHVVVNFFDPMFAHAFIIQNTTDNTVVNRMIYPANDVDYDAAAHAATEIYHEYLTAYAADDQHTTSVDVTIESRPISSTDDARVVAYMDHVLSLAS